MIEIDTDRTGFTIGNSGKPKEQRGSYYASLYAGALDGMTTSQYSYLDPYYNGFYSQAGNSQSYLAINNWTGDLASLKVGSTIDQLYESAFSNNWGYTQLTLKDVTVTAVSNVAPTPIPGAAVIMLGGLGVLGFLRRKFAR
ncbi:hypothetical protein [Maridesulfovibrio sp. FT414]|uniref:hypothetical protein n=1 Tax=Maridesulfovibrio sp. FT414 TaxID=2979469 RepID=UPI003D80840F